jgi:hypothetical protein
MMGIWSDIHPNFFHYFKRYFRVTAQDRLTPVFFRYFNGHLS